jgi:hypothetical protein
MRAWLWLGLVGCAAHGDCPAEDVAIDTEVGAGLAERLRGALVEMQQATSTSFCIDEVEVDATVSIPRRVGTRVTLADPADLDTVRRAVCELLVRDVELPPELYTDIRFELIAPPGAWDSPRARREAVFEAYCTAGPDTYLELDLAHDAACTTGNWQRDVTTHVQANAFDLATGPQLGTARLVHEPVGSWTIPDAFLATRGLGPSGDGWVVAGAVQDEERQWQPAFAFTGSEPWVLTLDELSPGAELGPVRAVGDAVALLAMTRPVPELLVLDHTGLRARAVDPQTLWTRIAAVDEGVYAFGEDADRGVWRDTLTLDGERVARDAVTSETAIPQLQGDPEADWTVRSDFTTASREQLFREGFVFLSQPPMALSLRKGERHLQVLFSSLRVLGDEIWARQERPDGSVGLFVHDADGTAWMVTEPCHVDAAWVQDGATLWRVRIDGQTLGVDTVGWEPIP